jgi:hypothetical protein
VLRELIATVQRVLGSDLVRNAPDRSPVSFVVFRRQLPSAEHSRGRGGSGEPIKACRKLQDCFPRAGIGQLSSHLARLLGAVEPAAAIRAAGYGAVWHGQKSWNGVAILARGSEPVETRRGLPGDPDDAHSRYIEAAIGGILVCCLYLPNGNPAPGPRFDYKLRWFERLTGYAQTLS